MSNAKTFEVTEHLRCTAIECGEIRIECHADEPHYTARVMTLPLIDIKGKGVSPSGALEDLRLELSKMVNFIEKVIRQSHSIFEGETKEAER